MNTPNHPEWGGVGNIPEYTPTPRGTTQKGFGFGQGSAIDITRWLMPLLQREIGQQYNLQPGMFSAQEDLLAMLNPAARRAMADRDAANQYGQANEQGMNIGARLASSGASVGTSRGAMVSANNAATRNVNAKRNEIMGPEQIANILAFLKQNSQPTSVQPALGSIAANYSRPVNTKPQQGGGFMEALMGVGGAFLGANPGMLALGGGGAAGGSGIANWIKQGMG